MLCHFRASRVAKRLWDVFYFWDVVNEALYSRPLKDTPEDSVLLVDGTRCPLTIEFFLLPSASPFTPVLNFTRVNKPQISMPEVRIRSNQVFYDPLGLTKIFFIP